MTMMVLMMIVMRLVMMTTMIMMMMMMMLMIEESKTRRLSLREERENSNTHNGHSKQNTHTTPIPHMAKSLTMNVSKNFDKSKSIT